MKKKDFIGKVKNKAGDVEKILKEKDKHGKIYIYGFNETDPLYNFKNFIQFIII